MREITIKTNIVTLVSPEMQAYYTASPVLAVRMGIAYCNAEIRLVNYSPKLGSFSKRCIIDVPLVSDCCKRISRYVQKYILIISKNNNNTCQLHVQTQQLHGSKFPSQAYYDKVRENKVYGVHFLVYT